MSDETRNIHFTLRDGSVWAVPVMTVARDRAKHYADEFDGDVERSLAEDTLPLFAEDEFEICEWAMNNMNWEDVKSSAFQISPATPLTERDFIDAWNYGAKDVEPAAKEPRP